jgi:hypothetical protein
MNPNDLAYLATPYSKMSDLNKAFRQAARIAAHLSFAGLKIFCPIAHAHALARASGIDPKNPALFAKLNEEMLHVCAVLVVAQMDGWTESDGVREEIDYFELHHKPIYDLDPASLLMERRKTKQELLLTDDRSDDRSPIVAQTSPYPFNKTRSEHGGSSA